MADVPEKYRMTGDIDAQNYWSRNGMATPRRELVMAFDHSVIYARDPKESELDEVRKHYTRL